MRPKRLTVKAEDGRIIGFVKDNIAFIESCLDSIFHWFFDLSITTEPTTIWN